MQSDKGSLGFSYWYDASGSNLPPEFRSHRLLPRVLLPVSRMLLLDSSNDTCRVLQRIFRLAKESSFALIPSPARLS